jgi:MerR family transcriptional regulator, thiopeptide resistance regulator
MDAKDYTVGAVAELTGVSVRTLHHYDELGLVQPGGRSAAGYRLYSPEDLRRLQRVLFYRELGFGLDVIAVIVADPGSTDGDHLRRQRQLLAARIARCQAMVAAVDKELSVRKVGVCLTPSERLEVFGSLRLRLEDLAGEVGADVDLAQQQRMLGYTVRDWQKLAGESARIHGRLLDAMNAGVPAGDPAVMDLAEEQRRHLDRWFHDCGHEVHRRCAEGWLEADDDRDPVLWRYIRDAVIANCQRAAGGQGHP